MSLLRSRTDPRWLDLARADLPAILADHAHCEKKAAASAVKLVAEHPDRPDLVRAVARLAQEELQHFLAVLAEMGRLGVALPPDTGDPYAQALLRCVRGGAGRLLDRLLAAALIEARSCERLALLAGALEEPRLRELYARLAQSEAGHERLFVELARRHGSGDVEARLAELAEEEARIVARLPLLPRIH
ncbi:tRNA isopentenyl-2-thiomethyl-A-37 hydroxylase MiaE [Anaeromyxobacter terrae]|uniref:tRNA isopentenyl-2-thiomethyl-A-37 hydroxylase MiaE n=1 Tax=Anaeromyxobacter terrae TaxID=2925406 RepID=UPI001F57A04F|nr:tRNA isopentenyl-2-thiomethyl-A-37 hydroxylase MiaE [Anaeromyxobacter sp. SG22]